MKLTRDPHAHLQPSPPRDPGSKRVPQRGQRKQPGARSGTFAEWLGDKYRHG